MNWRRILRPPQEPPLAPCPTAELPGSEGKLVVMQQRIAAGFSPFHPGDPHLDGVAEDVGLVISWRSGRTKCLPRVLDVVPLRSLNLD